MDQLGVASEDSEMSFSVRDENTGLEYNGTSLNSLFAQRSNLLKPAFWLMIKDILAGIAVSDSSLFLIS